MAEGVVPGGAVPGRHGEHVANARSKIGNAAVLRVVDEQRHDVGALLGPQIRDAGIAAQIGEGSTESCTLDVRSELGMD